MAMLYSPRSIADFPEHALSLLVKLVSLNRAARGELNHQKSSLPSYFKIPSSSNIRPDLRPIPEKTLSQSIERFIDTQSHQDCTTKIAQTVSRSATHYLEGTYWRFHHPVKLDPSIDEVFVDPNYPAITHANYLLQSDLVTISIDRNPQTSCNYTKSVLCEGDRYILNFIYPHLFQAYQNSLSLTNLQEQLNQCDRLKNRSLSLDSLQSLGLTKREAEVLYAIAKNQKNYDIALSLGCSLSTVKKHLEHIYEKLKVQTRTAAVMTALVKLDLISN